MCEKTEITKAKDMEFIENRTDGFEKEPVEDSFNAFRKEKAGFNGIRSFGVITAKDSDLTATGLEQYQQQTEELAKSLRSGHFAFVRQNEPFGNQTEQFCYIFNIPLDALIYYAGMYELNSFFFGKFGDDKKGISQYWTKQDSSKPFHKKRNSYVMDEETEFLLDTNLADDLPILGDKFKYAFPIKTFELVGNKIMKNIQEYAIEDTREDVEGFFRIATEGTGQVSWLYRGRMFRGMLNGEEKF